LITLAFDVIVPLDREDMRMENVCLIWVTSLWTKRWQEQERLLLKKS